MLRGGDVLDGKYTLIRLIGEGSVGAVWQATQSDLKRSVALKVIRDEIDDPALADLKREAEIQASLNHPGITIVHDFVQTNDTSFIVMEYLDGQNFEEILKTRPHGLHEATVLSMAAEISDALSAAHKLGLVHRDLKPANLFLEESNRVKICDFGIAVATADPINLTSASSFLTGTPQYMSPEQCEGVSLDARSDLYSLGCVLYELLTGQPPFTGKPETVMASHRSKRPIPLRLLRREVAAELNEVVMRLLAKDRQDRPSDARDLFVMLEELRKRSDASHLLSSLSTLSLSDLLNDPRYRELLGLLAVMPHGLHLSEIEYLTRQAGLSSQQIKDVFGRAEKGIFDSDGPVSAEHTVYRLGSEELQAEVTTTLGAGLMRGLSDRLHEWANECRSNGWQETTPACLLAGYARILAETGDVSRLTRYAIDAARHDLMFKVNGGDADALAEIGAAQEALLARQDQLDLRAVASMAVHRDELIGRDNAIPLELPVVWAMLGLTDRAERLTSCIPDTVRRAEAMAAVASAASTGRSPLAATPATVGTYEYGTGLDLNSAKRTQRLAAEALTNAAEGQADSARTLAVKAEEAIRAAAGTGRDHELAELSIALLMAGYRDESEQVRSCIREDKARSKAKAGIAFVTEIGYLREKTRTPGARAADIASACLRAGYTTEANIAATAAISAYVMRPVRGIMPEIIRKLPSQYRRQAIQAVATAQEFARREDSDYERGKALKRDVRSAMGFLFFGWQSITDSRWSENDRRLANSALKFAITSAHPLAETYARRISHPELRDPVLADVALAYAIIGRGARTLKIANGILNPQIRLRSVQEIGIVLAAAGRFDLVVSGVIAPMTDQSARDQTLAQIALVCNLALGHTQAVQAAAWISDRRLRALTLATIISETPFVTGADAMRLASEELSKVVRASAGSAQFGAPLLTDPEQYALVTSALMMVGLTGVAARVALESQAFADALPTGPQQVRALAGAAATLTKVPEMQLAANRRLIRSLIALALARGPWHMSLKALGDVDREILAHIAALLISYHHGPRPY